MTTHLTLAEFLQLSETATGTPPIVRDAGLLDAALARPQASVFGADAYADIWEKAAALLHSVACNHALIDGNKRSALLAALTMLDVNGVSVGALDMNTGIDLVLAVSTGKLDTVADISSALMHLVATGWTHTP